jgi:O-antigen biosynthesis protein WbqP
MMDVKCFLMTIVSVVKSDGVVEGGAGTIEHKEVAATKES